MAHITVNGERIEFAPGETLLQVAARAGEAIPTLCNDARLEPAGACRSCLVEVEGVRRLVPSCATPATDGAQVTTKNERIERHRKTLFSLYLTEHPHVDDPTGLDRGAPNKLARASKRFGAEDWGQLANQRDQIAGDRSGDVNPYIRYDSDLCILCAKCVRYCDEVEGVSAITLAGRGAQTTIATADSRSLMDTT